MLLDLNFIRNLLIFAIGLPYFAELGRGVRSEVFIQCLVQAKEEALTLGPVGVEVGVLASEGFRLVSVPQGVLLPTCVVAVESIN